jgi:hypothetical protein
MVIALGKARNLGAWNMLALGKDIFFKYLLCRAPGQIALGKEFF